MIVDDELFNRISAKIILKSAGIVLIDSICDTANNGEEAVQLIMEDAELNNKCCYDLILMDINMPVLDGCRATTKIREYLNDLQIDQPIICGVTGHTEQEYIDKCIKYGMNKVYSKPLNIALIKQLLKTLNYI